MTAYRTIDLTGMQPVTPASQPAPQVLWIEIANLVIDDRYQRPLADSNRAAIRRIAADFRWSRFSPVLVAPVEGGRYALIDGQHRAHAAALCGFERVPAMVALVAPEEQALAFIEINTRQIRVSVQSVYRAALTAGEPWAITAHDAVKAAGCQLMTRNNVRQKDKKGGQVFCVGLIQKLVLAGKADAVTRGLTALMAYDRTAAQNFSDALLTPLLTAGGEIGGTAPGWLATLHAKRPWLVLENADREADASRRPRAAARRDAFVRLYQRTAQEAAA